MHILEKPVKTKVIEFMSSLNDGGAETLVKDYACLLDKEIFDVCIVCIYPLTDTANYKRIRDENIRTIYIYKSHSIINRFSRKIFGKWYIPYSLKKIINVEKPNVIHIHLAQLKYIQRCKKALNNISLFYTCHSLPEKMFAGINKEEKKAADILIKEHNLHMIALHNEMATEINQMFHICNTKIIKNGVDFDKFRNVFKSKSELRDEYGIDKHALVIGNIGRLSSTKNQMFILRILNVLKNRGVNSKLLLIGSGPLEEEIKTKIRECNLENDVVLLSHRTDIPELLKTMDVFVFPSLYEGLSVTLVEAQVAGLKCVISDTINNESILSDKTIIVPLNSEPEIWADKILDNNIVNTNHGNIEEFNLKNEILHLQDLYLTTNQ